MRITYQVDDGYVGGGSRPQHVEIDDDEIEECESQADFEALVEQAIQEHFEQNIHTSYKMPKWPGKQQKEDDE